jgi:hypothetical protein
VTVIGEFEAAGVAEHVRMHAKGHLGGLPEPRNVPPARSRTGNGLALARAEVDARRAVRCRGERVDRGYAALEPGNVQAGMGKIDLLPAEGAQLGRSQAMPEG